MTAGLQTEIYNADGNSTGSSKEFQGRRRDDGQIQIEWTPDAGTSVTVKLQASMDNGQDTPWSTIKAWTQAELGTTAGSIFEKVIIGPFMRIVVSNTTDTDDNIKVWVRE